MGVTRNDVARRAGVSSAVVSYVLNNGPRPVAPETREKVLQAVQDLGYRTNLIAKSLRAQRTNTLGLVIPDISNTYFSELAKGVEDMAFSAGYTVIIGSTDNQRRHQHAYVESFSSRRVDGMIFASTEVVPEELDLMSSSGIPAVYITPEGAYENVSGDYSIVDVDQEKGGYAAGKHLVSLGHRAIACITGGFRVPDSERWSWQRVNGLLRALREAGLSAEVITTVDHPEEGFQAARELLMRPNRPTAIFTGNDLLAIGALRAAADLGLGVPQEISVCGFDDIDLASFVIPRLTTVRIEKYKQGWEATRMLIVRLDEIRSKRANERTRPDILQQQFEARLIIRESTGPAR